MNCPKCNNVLTEIFKFGSREYKCEKCGFGIAALVTEPIEEDYTQYHIYLTGRDKNISKIKTISKITKKNFVEVSTMFSNESLIYSGTAKDVVEVRKQLNEQAISFVIKPEFKW